MSDVKVLEQKEKEESAGLRTITTTSVSWLLASGWMFYFGSLLLNLVYYLMHPSSPEMWTWGREEKLEEWKPRKKKDTTKERVNYDEGREQEEDLDEWTPPSKRDRVDKDDSRVSNNQDKTQNLPNKLS